MLGCATNKNREIKARKIEAVLEDYIGGVIEGYEILDLGTGSGFIGNYFSENNHITYADVVDQRIHKAKDSFLHITNHSVPCHDASFDIIISNHVIEHTNKPRKHLQEAHRMLKDGGMLYIATPNRIFPIEPHYKLPFVHYAPYRWQKGIFTEDVYLLSYYRLKRMLSEFFVFQEYTQKILSQPKKYHSEITLFKNFHPKLIQTFCFLSPTNIYVMNKKHNFLI